MEKGFTPGPWRIVNCPCGNTHCNRKQFENVGTFYTGTGFEEADANLIAAAPDMFNALEGLVSEAIRQGMNLGPLIADGQAALSKATGGVK